MQIASTRHDPRLSHSIASMAASKASALQTQPKTAGTQDATNAKSDGPVAGALFSNGVLNTASLLSSTILSSLFGTNADGTVQTDKNGQPVLASPQKPLSGKDMVIANVVHASMSAPDGVTSKVTDQNKAFVRATTGYNFVVPGDGSWSFTDDSGNPVPLTPALSALGISIIADHGPTGRLGGNGDITPDYFSQVMKDNAGTGSAFPDDWANKSLAWFDSVQDGRSESAQTPSETKESLIAAAGTAAYQATLKRTEQA